MPHPRDSRLRLHRGYLTKAGSKRYKWDTAAGQLQAYAGLEDGIDGVQLVTGAVAYNDRGFIAAA